MKKALPALAFLPLLSAASFAQQPEAALSRAAAMFGAAAPAAPRASKAEPVQDVVLEGGAQAQGVKTLSLRGYLSLSGNGFAPRGSGYATVTVSGWTQLQDQDGRYLGNVYFSATDGYFVSGGHVSGWARPYAYVNVYDGGKLLGTARVDGSIFVSGWANGGSIMLSGAGPVQGSLTYTSPDQP